MSHPSLVNPLEMDGFFMVTAALGLCHFFAKRRKKRLILSDNFFIILSGR